MAKVANTFTSTSAKGNREELSDVVDMITPEDTPIYSALSKGSFKTTHPEWTTDEMDPPADNAQPEGNEYSFGAIKTPERYGTYTQIMSKTGIVSGTQEVTDEAGQATKTKRQKLKKGKELRKDIEFAIVSGNASVAGETRKFGSLSTWLETNVSRGADGANGGFDEATGLTVAPTDGTQRAFSKAILDDVMQQGYNAGANFGQLSCSPHVKSVFVTFMSDPNVANYRYAVTSGKNNAIVSNADIYEGPFGKIMVKPNRVMAASAAVARNAFFLDSEYVEFGWLRKIHEDKDIAKTGDAKKFVLIGEGALKLKNEKGLGVAADLFGLNAAA